MHDCLWLGVCKQRASRYDCLPLDAHKALGASVVARGGGDANAAWRLKHVAQHHALAVSSREARHRQNAERWTPIPEQ